MKGYFQKLATQTGLNFSPGGTSSSAEPATPSHLSSSSVASPASLAVETVSFTAQPPGPGDETSSSNSVTDWLVDQNSITTTVDAAAVGPNTGGEAENRSSSQESVVEIGPVTLQNDSRTSWGRAETQRGDSASGGLSALETEQVFRIDEIESDKTSLRESAESQFVTRLESSAGNASRPPILSNDQHAIDDTVVWQENQTDRTRLSEQLQSPDEAQGRRNEEVGSYLKEVMEWIAARPETNDEDANGQISDAFAEGAASAADVAGANSSGLDFRNESQVDQTRDPDIQDLNLSIGTISIVVEDPSGLAALPLAPIQTQPAPSSAASHEPTNLSRYYLRSW